MSEYVIMTDNTVDMPLSWFQENQVDYLCLSCNMDGEIYDKEHVIDDKEFYRRMRAGSMPTTSQVNPTAAEEIFESVLKEGKDVLYLAFSSGLSGTYNSCRVAAEELRESYPDRRIEVIDTLAASMGEGLLVWYAAKMKAEGRSMEEVVQWVRENILHTCHVFTVDDLNHLYRGGRVSKATAVLGTLANIKPMLHVDNEGKLIPVGKVRGRKKSLATLVSMMEERVGAYRSKNEMIIISHGDCEEDAAYVAKLVEEKFGITHVMMNPIGATIGAHAGPGTVALFFLGDYR